MNATVNVTAIVPPTHYGFAPESDVCYSVHYGLQAEFGDRIWSLEDWVGEAGPTSHSPGSVWVEATFESDLPRPELERRLGAFRAGGLNDEGEWDIPLETVAIS